MENAAINFIFLLPIYSVDIFYTRWLLLTTEATVPEAYRYETHNTLEYVQCCTYHWMGHEL